jgi:hypothetical protein
MKSRRKMIVIVVGGAAGVLILACLSVAVRAPRSRAPQPQAAAPAQTAAYLASEAFVKLAPDEQRRYLQAIQVPGSKTPVLALLFHPDVSDEQRRRMLENILPVVGPVINQRLDEFDRLPPAEQTARLDAVIDQLQAARQNNAGTMSSVERMNLVLQYLDPYTRAKMRKHIPALLVRMQERGIQVGYPF